MCPKSNAESTKQTVLGRVEMKGVDLYYDRISRRFSDSLSFFEELGS